MLCNISVIEHVYQILSEPNLNCLKSLAFLALINDLDDDEFSFDSL